MSPQTELESELLGFYREKRDDHRGRKLSTILAEKHEWLENSHDYIQWLFPLTEPSAFNCFAPILSKHDIEAFHADVALRARLRDAFNVMLSFYGLRLAGGSNANTQVVIDSAFEVRRQNWITDGNHNFLRITRILKSLCILGLRNEASAFFECLGLIYEQNKATVGQETFGFWGRAVK